MTLTNTQRSILKALQPKSDGSRAMLHLPPGGRAASIFPGDQTVSHIDVARLLHLKLLTGGPWYTLTPAGCEMVYEEGEDVALTLVMNLTHNQRQILTVLKEGGQAYAYQSHPKDEATLVDPITQAWTDVNPALLTGLLKAGLLSRQKGRDGLGDLCWIYTLTLDGETVAEKEIQS